MRNVEHLKISCVEEVETLDEVNRLEKLGYVLLGVINNSDSTLFSMGYSDLSRLGIPGG